MHSQFKKSSGSCSLMSALALIKSGVALSIKSIPLDLQCYKRHKCQEVQGASHLFLPYIYFYYRIKTDFGCIRKATRIRIKSWSVIVCRSRVHSSLRISRDQSRTQTPTIDHTQIFSQMLSERSGLTKIQVRQQIS